MTADNMIARVAAGIWGRWIRGRLVPEQWRGVTWEELNRLAETNARARELVEAAHDEARGAMEAMREPTLPMLTAAGIEAPESGIGLGKAIYQAMIDAALNEPDPTTRSHP